jgi:DNA-binding transcriptional ArsR family regulator
MNSIFDDCTISTSRPVVARLQSRTSPSVRCEDWGRNANPRAQLYGYSQAELEQNREAEALMMDKWAASVPLELKTPQHRHQRNFASAEELRDEILATLQEPMTIRQISSEVGASGASVVFHLRKMEQDGKVESTRQGKYPNGTNRPILWSVK